MLKRPLSFALAFTFLASWTTSTPIFSERGHLFPNVDKNIGTPLEVRKQTNPASNFTDEFARNRLFPLAAAAYSDMPNECLSNQFADAMLIRFVNITCDSYDKNDVCAAFIAISPADKAVIVSFRGTAYFVELIVETTEVTFEKLVPSPIGGNVAHYFHLIFEDLWFNNSIGRDFLELAKANPTYDIWVTGHSLGGAVASIATAQILTDYGSDLDANRIKLYTFGQPRTGDGDYAHAIDSRLPYNTFRVNHARDWVSHLPPMSYKNYTHFMTEVWYHRENMGANAEYIICANSDENKSCSDEDYLFNVWDHLYYYGLEVSGYGQTGCK